MKTNLTTDEENRLSFEEIIEDEDIDYSCRYFLKHREMPRDQFETGCRERDTATHCFLCDEAFLEGEKKLLTTTILLESILG